MRFSSALKYHLYNEKWPVIIFYIVIYALIALVVVSHLLLADVNVNSKMGGLDSASIIFLFVVGLNAFKSPFQMLVANGISRKTMFTSFLTAAAILSVGMAVIDSLNTVLLNQFVNYEPIVLQMFGQRYSGFGAAMLAEGFLWRIFCYCATAMVGFFVTTSYYRMSKALKLIVSVGVPVFFVILLPIIDVQLFSGRIYEAIFSAIAHCSGVISANPYIGMLSSAALLVLSGALSYLLIRRVPVKM